MELFYGQNVYISHLNAKNFRILNEVNFAYKFQMLISAGKSDRVLTVAVKINNIIWTNYIIRGSVAHWLHVRLLIRKLWVQTLLELVLPSHGVQQAA